MPLIVVRALCAELEADESSGYTAFGKEEMCAKYVLFGEINTNSAQHAKTVNSDTGQNLGEI